jgi:hypothetical protein
MPEKFRSGFVIAAASMLRDKIAEMELSGSGRA